MLIRPGNTFDLFDDLSLNFCQVPCARLLILQCVFSVGGGVWLWLLSRFSAVSLSRRQNGKNSDGSEEERARSLARKWKRKMQPQCCEVRIENDEYEREQQRLVKQIKHVVILRNDHILAFCVVQKHAHILELFQRNAYALPSFHTSLHMHDRLSQKHVAHLLPVTVNPYVLVQRSWKCERGIHCGYQRRLKASN